MNFEETTNKTADPTIQDWLMHSAPHKMTQFWVPTGKKVQVTAQDLIKCVIRKLELYDIQLRTTQNRPRVNPYTQEIICQIDGKTVRVPENIQKQAINIWYARTGVNVPAQHQESQETVQLPVRRRTVIVKEDGYDFLNIGILILAAILALYFYVKLSQSESGAAGSKRYFLSTN
jgi:hypothetical protein